MFTFDTLAVDPFLDPTIVNNMGFTPTDDLTLSIVGNSVVLHGVSMVPEPSTLGLIGLGLLVLRRRRKA